jgi:hypothetical protein
MAWLSDEAYEFTKDSIEKKITARSARNMRTHNGKGGPVKFPSDYLSKKELKAMNGECKSYRLNAPMTWEEFKDVPDDLKVCYIKALRNKFNVPNNAIAEMFGVSAPVVTQHFKCYGLAEGKGASASKRNWNKEGWLAWLHGANPGSVKPSETPVENNEVVTDEEHEIIIGETAASVALEDAVGAEKAESIEKLCEEAYEAIVKPNNDEAVNKFFRNEAVKQGYLVTPEEDDTCSKEKTCAIPITGDMSFDGPADDILRTIGMLLQNNVVHLSVQWTVD